MVGCFLWFGIKGILFGDFIVKAVIASWAEPWFEDAENTVITILQRKNTSIKYSIMNL